jgi:hypothetical protein
MDTQQIPHGNNVGAFVKWCWDHCRSADIDVTTDHVWTFKTPHGTLTAKAGDTVTWHDGKLVVDTNVGN